MPIISKGGRKSWKTRLVFLSMYAVLIIGTITMLYPFLLMVSSSFATSFDFDDLKIIPDYLTSDSALLKKHLYEKYGQENFRELALTYKRDDTWKTWGDFRKEEKFVENNFSEIQSSFLKNPNQMGVLVSDFNEFKKTLELENVVAFYPDDLDAFRIFLRKKYQRIAKGRQHSSTKNLVKPIDILNRRWDRAFNSFSDILPLKCFPRLQKWFPPKRADFNDLLEFHNSLPGDKLKFAPTKVLWGLYLSNRFVSVAKFDAKTGLRFKRFSDIPIPEKNDTTVLSTIWNDFLKKKYPLRLISVQGNHLTQWRSFIKESFKSVSAFNKQCGAAINDFEDVSFSATPPENPILRTFWLNYVLKNTVPNEWKLNRPVTRFRSFMKRKYKSVAALNEKCGTNYPAFSDIQLPLKIADYYHFAMNKSSIRKAFITMNYSKVLDFLFKKGRAVWVTILLVTLVILGALTVNPLAAYALSRGRQSTSSKFLIFFLATMAFPAEVAMIPGFLLLRDLNMLNTFAALVLPGLANGYSIFLLKGFFDSVPRELFEAADIDGANELQKFWNITFPMSKPILAVIALNAFKLAYGGFMWAFLTCQDPKMWTIMVWLYDFQGRYGAMPGMCMAAFVLASIPTLLVFLFCQKIIMRGIVIPTMK